MTTAFVMSGGASLGAAQVGMLQSLASHGIWPPDVLVGTSVGAINAAWVAGHPEPRDVEGLVAIWRALRRADVFPTRPLKGLLGFLGRADHLVSARGLIRILESNLTFDALEDAAIPLHVVATELTNGSEVILSSGPAVESIVASAAIPGVFAPVRLDGRVLVDGGVADNTPLSCAAALGADPIYVLPASYPCTLTAPPPTALGVIVQAINIMVHERLIVDVVRHEAGVQLFVVPPLCPVGISPVDFGHSATLIERARRSTDEWLAQGEPPPGQAAVLARSDHEPT